MSSYAAEDEVDLNDDVDLDIGSLKEQESDNLIDKARKVRFEIKKAEIRTNYDDKDDKSNWVKRLSLQTKIGEDGIDGQGGSAGRMMFPDFVVAFTSESGLRDSEWWQKKARGPAKDFLAALGFDPAAPPRINKDFLDSLIGMEYFADIQHEKVQEKTDEINPKTRKPVYKDTGEFRNKQANFRAV